MFHQTGFGCGNFIWQVISRTAHQNGYNMKTLLDRWYCGQHTTGDIVDSTPNWLWCENFIRQVILQTTHQIGDLLTMFFSSGCVYNICPVTTIKVDWTLSIRWLVHSMQWLHSHENTPTLSPPSVLEKPVLVHLFLWFFRSRLVFILRGIVFIWRGMMLRKNNNSRIFLSLLSPF